MTLAETGLERLAKAVRVAVFDVDGVLTDGSILLGPQGEEYKRFNVRDGHGFTLLQEAGIAVAVITGRSSSVVTHRMRELGVRFLYQGCRDKLSAVRELCMQAAIETGQLCYLGDDLPDIPALRVAGLAVAVADAHAAVLAVAHCRTRAAGGHGAARELAEFLVNAQGKLQFGCAGLVPLDHPPGL